MQNYTALLTFLNDHFTIRQLKHHEQMGGKRSVCLLRHDVTDDINAALLMAEKENALGIRSTYFFLPSAENFDMGTVREVQALGHEVGLLNNVLTRCLDSRRVGYAKRLFEEDLGIFKDAKVRIHGVSSLDCNECKHYNVHNRDIFKEYHKKGKPVKVKHTALFTLSLKKYRLYEADFVFFEHRFSDNGGVWNEGQVDNVGIYPYLQGVSSSMHTTAQVIVHPKEWQEV